jgi:hypothetical protein
LIFVDMSTALILAHFWLPCSIQALLSAPNPDDPLAENVAKHWKENEAEAVETGELFCGAVSTADRCRPCNRNMVLQVC